MLADDVGAHRLEGADLRHGGGDIAGLGVGHALHRDRRITTNRHFADHDLARFAANDWALVFHKNLPGYSAAPSVKRAIPCLS
jgi:hypothetical protein